MQNPAFAYRPDIDGLRAVAVLAVLGFHAFPDLIPGGFVGVDIFFVISGYLISSIILAQLGKQSFSLTGFYARRVKRIFPALLLVLTSCLGIGWFILLPDEFRSLGQHTAAASIFGSNIWLWHEVAYFDTVAELKPLLHLWSLAIEEQFYIIWPALLFLFTRCRSITLVLILIAGIVSFASCLHAINEQPAMFYFPWNRAWELLVGAALAEYLSRPHHPLTPTIASVLSLMGIGLIAVAIALIDKYDTFPGWLAIIPTWGAALLIASGTRALPNRLLGFKPLVLIGLISYPLYLWHWPLLVFARIIEGSEPSIVIRIIALAVSAVLAGLTYIILERPLRTGGHFTITALTAAMIVTGCLGYSAGKEFIKPRSALSGLDAIMKAPDDWGYEKEAFIYRELLFSRIGETQGPATIFIGDSNMEQYLPRISHLITNDPHTYQRAIYTTSGSCPPIRNIRDPSDSSNRCHTRMDAAYRLAMETTDINKVVIAALWFGYFIGTRDIFYDDKGIHYAIDHYDSEGARKAYAELEVSIQQLQQSGKKVYLIANIPFGAELNPRGLVSRSWKTLGSDFRMTNHSLDGISRKGFESTMAPVNVVLKGIAQRTGATLLDPADWLCDTNHCPPLTDDGFPIYKDSEHLCASFVIKNLSALDETIKK